jgi:hypothetical protein
MRVILRILRTFTTRSILASDCRPDFSFAMSQDCMHESGKICERLHIGGEKRGNCSQRVGQGFRVMIQFTILRGTNFIISEIEIDIILKWTEVNIV